MEDVCYLYWIRSPTHNDMFSEGYIGISNNPDCRLTQHISNSANPNEWHRYRTAFKMALSSGVFVREILVCSTRQYCLDLEAKLRPDWVIGWNIAKGGEGGGAIKHGLSGTRGKKAYYNICTKIKASAVTLCEEWSDRELGLQNFCKFYDALNLDEGAVLSIVGLDSISPDTIRVVSFKEAVSISRRSHDLGDGKLYTLAEIADKFGIKQNTLVWRLKRGSTLREAVGLDEKPKKLISIKNKSVGYKGRMTKDQINSFMVDVESGIPLLHLEDKYGFDAAQLSRLAKRFEIKIPEVFISDLMGGQFKVGSHSKLSEEDYDMITKGLLEGETKTSISEKLGLSASSITNACKKLKWYEFLNSEEKGYE